MNALDQMVRRFSSLPGIGKKSATRLAYFLLERDRSYIEQFAQDLLNLSQKMKRCSLCRNYAESDPCSICEDPGRDRSVLCVVESPQDVMLIESTHEFNGSYFVLNGVISPINGIGPADLGFDVLLKRIEREEVQEIIIATNPTTEGDTTALYIKQLTDNKGINISRLASGLPVGGDLGYVDKMTLLRSFKGRRSLD